MADQYASRCFEYGRCVRICVYSFLNSLLGMVVLLPILSLGASVLRYAWLASRSVLQTLLPTRFGYSKLLHRLAPVIDFRCRSAARLLAQPRASQLVVARSASPVKANLSIKTSDAHRDAQRGAMSNLLFAIS